MSWKPHTQKKSITEPQFGGEEGCIMCGGIDPVMITMFRKQTLLESNLFFKVHFGPIRNHLLLFYSSIHPFNKPLFEYPK